MPFPRKIDGNLAKRIRTAARENYSHPWNLEVALRRLPEI